MYVILCFLLTWSKYCACMMTTFRWSVLQGAPVFSTFFVGMGTRRLKMTETTQPFGKPLSAAILIQDLMSWAFWSLFITSQIWCSLLPEKLSRGSQATNAQGWIVLLKEASLCPADNQTNGCPEIGRQWGPTAPPSLIQAWALFPSR